MYLMIGSQLNPFGFRISKCRNKEKTGAPALVVNLITITRRVNNIQPQPNTVFDDDYPSSELQGRLHDENAYHETRPGFPWSV